MAWRVGTLWGSSLRHDRRSFSLALFRGILPLIAIPVVLLPAAFADRNELLGGMLFRLEAEIALFVCIALAHYLGSDAAGDGQSGILELVSLSGISAAEWILHRLFRIWTNFLLVWCVRLPFVAFLGTLGGVTDEQWLHKELLLLLIFAIGSTYSMVVSHAADTRQKAWGRLLFMVFAVELIGSLPMLAVTALSALNGISLPTAWVRTVDSWPPFGLWAAVNSMFTGSPAPGELWLTALVHGLAVVAGLAWLAPRVFTLVSPPEEMTVTARVKQLVTTGPTLRSSRRCWDDALAWHAFACHSSGRRGLAVKIVLYLCVAAILVWIHRSGEREFAAIMGMAWASAVLFHSANKPADCINREVRDKTLSTLALLPMEPIEYYRGWRRGSWVLAVPDLVVFVGVFAMMFTILPAASPILLAIGGVVLSLSPLFALSAVTNWSARGWATGVSIIFGLLACIALCTVVSAVFSSTNWTIPLVTIPVSLLYGWLIRRFALPWWMREKIITTS